MANNNNSQSPEQITFGSQQDQGRRKKMEDRLRVDNINTAGGLNLTVAMVADGIGGNVFGERAAELAIEVTFQEIMQSDLADPKRLPILLQGALLKANDAVFEEARRDRTKRGMGSTATIAVIHQDHLYMANVGDSRAYLIRDGEAIQLTRDHTWGLEMLDQGLITPDQLVKHPKSGELARSIGYDADLEVDLGIYLNGEGGEEEALENQGMLLQVNDRLLLCSDGLIKERHDGQGHYVEPQEIYHVLTHRAPQAAAEDLVSKAIKRDADDNVSTIVLEMPGSKRSFYLPPAVLYGVGALLAVLILIAAAFLLLPTFQNDPIPEANETNGQTFAATSPTEPSPTSSALAGIGEASPTPETTILVVAAQGNAAWDVDQEVIAPQNGQRLPVFGEGVDPIFRSGNEPAQLTLYDGSQLWLDGNTEIIVIPPSENGGGTSITLSSGKLVLQSSGPVRISNPLGAWAAVDQPGSLMGVYQEPTEIGFEAHCLQGGQCIVHGDLGQETNISPGWMSRVGSNGQPGEPEPLDVNLFHFSSIVPEATATLQATETPMPTMTPTPPPTRLPPTPTPTPIPDKDGDGILDGADQCPNTPGVQEYGGCPEPTPEPPRPEKNEEKEKETKPKPTTPPDR